MLPGPRFAPGIINPSKQLLSHIQWELLWLGSYPQFLLLDGKGVEKQMREKNWSITVLNWVSQFSTRLEINSTRAWVTAPSATEVGLLMDSSSTKQRFALFHSSKDDGPFWGTSPGMHPQAWEVHSPGQQFLVTKLTGLWEVWPWLGPGLWRARTIRGHVYLGSSSVPDVHGEEWETEARSDKQESHKAKRLV